MKLPVSVELIAVLVAVTDDEPRVLTIADGRAILTLVLFDLERPAEAAALVNDIDAALRRSKAPPSYAIYCFGSALARLVASSPPGPEREALAERAVAQLRRAVLAGQKKVKDYRDSDDLASLRPRADFQDLVRDLSFPSLPFAR